MILIFLIFSDISVKYRTHPTTSELSIISYVGCQFPILTHSTHPSPLSIGVNSIPTQPTPSLFPPPTSFNSTPTVAASAVGVLQSVANHDPDVDAIYRLSRSNNSSS
ncbi:hypothetical protein T492DRAFT_486106 [Pavlovales sp. CCMP2436]|nr:hypothetical protein T492DRAFT_486106 [Pavlovales sp. CCMP2436]